MTKNHDYNTPQQGATDWYIPLNENFAALDADVEIRDVEANRDQYDPQAKAKFLATDTGAVYVGDGSTWNHLGDLKQLDGGISVQSGVPSSPSKDDLWVDTDDATLAFYDGSSWVPVDGSTSDSTDSGSTTSIIEDGESDLSAYVGDTSYFGITSDAIAGSGSVVAIDAEHRGYRTITSTSGLANYPQVGDSFRCDLAIDTDNTYAGVLWGVQSTSSPWPCYRLRVDTGATPGVELEKVTTSAVSHDITDLDSGQLHYTDVEPEIGTVYRLRVTWNADGTMPFTVTDLADGTVLAQDEAPVADEEYTGGGVGFMSSRSWGGQDQAKVRFDGYELI